MKPAAPAEAPAKAAPPAPGQPIPLWRDKDGKTVRGPGIGEKTVSSLTAEAGR